MASKRKKEPTEFEATLASMDAEEARLKHRLDEVNKARDATVKAIDAIKTVYQQERAEK